MGEFYNPYHFVPVTKEGSIYDLPVTELKNPAVINHHVRHDRYCEKTIVNNEPVFSGRLICRLTTKGPVVIGNEHEPKKDPEEPTVVKPFKLSNGEPIIPGSTLRGLISSIAEAASNSALRVLTNQEYSYRGQDRRRHSAGTTFQHFRKLSEEKLPFNSKRKTISLAEQIFGFVEQRREGEQRTEEAMALAGRVRFSNATLAPEVKAPYFEAKRVLLKILGSPKPPQPAFYFKQRGGVSGCVPVGSLQPSQYVPQGRKFYLHRWTEDIDPWQTGPNLKDDPDRNQKSWVEPLRQGVSFYFHIDFENLSQTELALICYAIRPAESFHHKIGMGKPIGLGSIRIDPEGLFLIDRHRRYLDDPIFGTARYHHAWIKKEDGKQWPQRYSRELQEIRVCSQIENGFEDFRHTVIGKINQDIRTALELLGNPSMVKKPVHTPQIANTPDPEKKTFTWFVENQKRGSSAQYLIPLTRDSKELPTLNNSWERDGGSGAKDTAPKGHDDDGRRSKTDVGPNVRELAPWQKNLREQFQRSEGGHDSPEKQQKDSGKGAQRRDAR